MKLFIPIKHISQRVPRKNFRDFNNEPLYKHTLLKFCKYDIFVDTDSEEIKQNIAEDIRLKNIQVIERKESLKGHNISVCLLIEDFIMNYKINEPIVQLHVTSPFLRVQTIEHAYKLMADHDSVVSCNTYHSRFWRKERYGFCPVNHNPVDMQQTQDLPKIYEENSAFYIFAPKSFLSTGSRVGKKPFFYEIQEPENIDIDNESDWQKCLNHLKI
jgi:CMP-N-acetylneuraminic acid synthetase